LEKTVMDENEKSMGRFRTTRWTLVVRSQGSGESASRALDELCERYWFPLYCYARRWGCGAADAEDLVQGFFCLVLTRGLFDEAAPELGRLRSFLLTAFQRFMRDGHRKARAQKRGGEHRLRSLNASEAEDGYISEPAHRGASPEQAFEWQWAMSVLVDAMSLLKASYESRGQQTLYEHLLPGLEGGDHAIDYDAVATSLSMQAGTVRVAMHRMRQRLGDRLREVVRDTVADEAQVEQEIRHLQQALSVRVDPGEG